ncbi:glutathione S-transferase family protein [Pseudomonas sp. PD9R]|uniref:glutathione S-transferase family protein n=1 Tax=Pseudomonas sp. PD9R TaxID=2853534 RepID=UPI001C44F409|nr:glutathione S-transferase family protein [Pseudomonas sp. PD9R]MBV6823118.1 glutathione S-transferase family protein [Pseudomonas sp. PD9R]
MTISIYGDTGSGSFRRVLTAAKHMGIEFEHIPVDLLEGESQAPEFLTINPAGRVPVLVEGDTVISEASAINLYLAEKFDSPLLPKGDARYETIKWMFWAAEHWRVFSSYLFNERIGKRVMGVKEDPTMVEFIFNNIRANAAVLDKHLEDKKFIVGNQVTLADFDIAAPFSQMARTKLPYAEFPNIMAWQQRLLDEVPAWKETKQLLDHRMDSAFSAFGITF